MTVSCARIDTRLIFDIDEFHGNGFMNEKIARITAQPLRERLSITLRRAIA